MKICVAGIGAIGGFIAARLAAAGNAEICALARGQTLRALRERGLRLSGESGNLELAVAASDDPHVMLRRRQDPGPLFPWQDIVPASGLERLKP